MCRRPAQINNTARMSCHTIFITTYIGADLLKSLKEICKCEHMFYEKIDDLNGNHYNCTDGTADELRYDMIKYNKKGKTLLLLIEMEL